MEEDTINNLAYEWLTGDMTIDHSTMVLPARFDFKTSPSVISSSSPQR